MRPSTALVVAVFALFAGCAKRGETVSPEQTAPAPAAPTAEAPPAESEAPSSVSDRASKKEASEGAALYRTVEDAEAALARANQELAQLYPPPAPPAAAAAAPAGGGAAPAPKSA